MLTSGKKILVVEDDRPLSRALELKLTNEGFQPIVVSDGEQALKILENEKFDLILLDLILPKVDGFGVLAELKSKNSTIPVIVLSNLGQEADAKKAKELGALNYFIKSDTSIASIIEYIKANL